MTSKSIAVPLALVAALLAAVASPQEATPPPFSETIEVREVEIFFDLSPLPRFESMGKKAIDDFAAFEGGKVHDLVEMTAMQLCQSVAQQCRTLVWIAM